MKYLLAPLAFALALQLSPSLRAQTYLTVEEDPPGVRVVDVTAGVLIGDRLIDLTTAQPPLANINVGNAIAVNSEIWVSAGNRVYRYDTAGIQIGSTAPFVPVPLGMDFVGGSVWVAATTDLLEFAPNGTLIATHPVMTAQNVLGYNGQLLVSNATTKTIDVFDLNGQFLSVFSSGPVPAGNVWGPGQLALDPASGNILVESGIRIFEVDPTGTVVGDWEAGSFEMGVAPLDDGRLLVNLYASTVIFDKTSGESITVAGFDPATLRDLSLAGPGNTAYRRYCPANANSTGLSGQVGAFGTTSVGGDTFALHATLVPPNQFGYFFYGPNTGQVAWGDGVLCTGTTGLNRILPGLSIPAGGVLASDLSFATLPPAGAIVAGSTWSFQFVFRDPTGGPAGFNATDAVRLTFLP